MLKTSAPRANFMFSKQKSGLRNIRSQKYRVSKISGLRNMGSQKYGVTEIWGHRNIESEKYWVTEILGHRNIGSQKYWVSEISGLRNIGSQKYQVSELSGIWYHPFIGKIKFHLKLLFILFYLTKPQYVFDFRSLDQSRSINIVIK